MYDWVFCKRLPLRERLKLAVGIFKADWCQLDFFFGLIKVSRVKLLSFAWLGFSHCDMLSGMLWAQCSACDLSAAQHFPTRIPLLLLPLSLSLSDQPSFQQIQQPVSPVSL